MIKISKTLPHNKIRFALNFEKLFVFVLQCIQKENVHNRNRKWARSVLKTKYQHKTVYKSYPQTNLLNSFNLKNNKRFGNFCNEKVLGLKIQGLFCFITYEETILTD